ncbi:MAG TPA: Spy/CpxP family protein refolding chaperone [Gemmatimonadaceae bacterium]|nr:Spy/CpxP family protein refolding chaperone [Gemmatimonadaceae bacterium]
MHMPRMRTALRSAALLLVATTLPSQQPAPRRMPPASMRESCPMMGVMERSPSAVLHNRDRLHLSPAQVTRLEAMVRDMDAMHGRAMDSMMVVHQQLSTIATTTTFDEPRVRSALDRMGQLHTQMGVEMLRAQYTVGSILTAPQRDTLEALARRHASMPGMGQARPGECPMMMMMGTHARAPMGPRPRQ